MTQNNTMKHQYIDRATTSIKTETLFHDKIVNFIYSTLRERSRILFKLLTSARVSSLLSFINYDFPLGPKITGGFKFLENLGIDMNECLDDVSELDTARKVFERKIKYWECRPISIGDNVITSPADAKCIIGSFRNTSQLFIKEKFFNFEELLGSNKREWLKKFYNGDFAIFRLTPEKYHYNHAPVSGKVVDIYEIDGKYNSCNPAAIVKMVTPFSKNKRVVTIFDTNVEGGTNIGYVAMIEVVALMIGDIRQCYSEHKYDSPHEIHIGQFIKKGQPKSLYKPGSSVDIVIFEKSAVKFSTDLVTNIHNTHAQSRFTNAFQVPLVETDIQLRSEIAVAK